MLVPGIKIKLEQACREEKQAIDRLSGRRFRHWQPDSWLRRPKLSASLLPPLQLLIILSTLFKSSDQLRFSSIQIPTLVERGTNFVLGCVFELEPSEQLYSVKWYKDNEEFYKQLQWPRVSQDETSANELQQTSANQQQQQFSQAGVNVRMSLSNATHVHMLNASLESEGAYACEISTQNLSTIRYEKEIRIYALPQSKLNVIGFRQRYALEDKLELVCSSDFSRPRPALAWFVNGQRISQTSSGFELESSSQLKPSDATLAKVSLALRFKLSSSLLTSLMTNNQTSSQDNLGLAKLVGRSLKLQCKYRLAEVSDVAFNELILAADQFQQSADHVASFQPDSLASEAPDDATIMQQRRRRQTLSQLASGQLEDANLSAARGEIRSSAGQVVVVGGLMGVDKKTSDCIRTSEGQDLNLIDASKRELASEKSLGAWRKRRSAAGAATTGNLQQTLKGFNEHDNWPAIIKLGDENRLIQSKSPAEGRQLGALLSLGANWQQHVGRGVSWPTSDAGSCASGALSLLPDDPVLVEAVSGSGAAKYKSGRGDNQRAATLNNKLARSKGSMDNLEEQAWLNEASATANKRRRNNNNNKQRQLDMNLNYKQANDDNDASGSKPQLASMGGDSNLEHFSVDCMSIAALLAANRASSFGSRQLVGGDNDDESSLTTTIKQPPLSVLSMAGSSRLCNNDQARRHWSISGRSTFNEQPVEHLNGVNQRNNRNNNNNNARVAYLNISQQHSVFLQPRQVIRSRRRAAKKSSAEKLTSLKNPQPFDTSSSQIFAPPLLEWFINNHEAPSSSVNYPAELPLLATTPRAQSGARRVVANNSMTNKLDELTSTLDDADAQGNDVAPVNYIDYAEYFANFDSKPREQQLNLKLELNKKLFMTPDSKLRLRCSSTQAQILMVDSVDLTVVLVSNEHTIADHLQQTTASSWQKRRLATSHNGYYHHLPNNHHNNNLNSLKINNPTARSSYLEQLSKNKANAIVAPSGLMPIILVIINMLLLLR